MNARKPHTMAQFGLAIEKLSHIIGTALILEMARAYGRHPRLGLPFLFISVCLFGELQTCLKGTSDAYNKLIYIVQRVHFQSESVFC